MVIKDFIMNNDLALKYERFFNDPLFCSFSKALEKTGIVFKGLNSVDIWSQALEVLSSLSDSKRPELLVRGLYSELVKDYDTDTAGVILICVMYMICGRDDIKDNLYLAAKEIAYIVVDHPMLINIFARQREAERKEEESGNHVPIDFYQSKYKGLLEDPASPYGGNISLLDDDLLTCIADKDCFDEFVKIINGEILAFIKSPEGGAQFWEVVKDVSIEKGYISRRCRRNRFARIISAICPNAGEARKIDQNMQKYSEIDPKKSNDYAAIRSRFVFNITK